jgi:hypothetical protein
LIATDIRMLQEQNQSQMLKGSKMAFQQSPTKANRHGCNTYTSNKLKPTNATGVPVSIDVIDTNGNYRNIGSTTSDTSGTFSFTWKPDIAGDYAVIATFDGSNSYYRSTAESHFTASQLEDSATPQPIVAQAPVEMYITGATIATIAAIAIVGAILFLATRKR